jgi:hypothetical protein
VSNKVSVPLSRPAGVTHAKRGFASEPERDELGLFWRRRSWYGCEADEGGFGFGWSSKGLGEARAVVMKVKDEDRDGLGGFALEGDYRKKDVVHVKVEDESRESLEANSEDELDVIRIPEHP